MEFLEAANRLHILVHIIPSHSTHRLQPLDVRLFGPLSTAYSNELDKLQHNGLSLVSITKRLFYILFREAWQAAFTAEHIHHAFEKTGI
jgi:DDE superfamily endonuclease